MFLARRYPDDSRYERNWRAGKEEKERRRRRSKRRKVEKNEPARPRQKFLQQGGNSNFLAGTSLTQWKVRWANRTEHRTSFWSPRTLDSPTLFISLFPPQFLFSIFFFLSASLLLSRICKIIRKGLARMLHQKECCTRPWSKWRVVRTLRS